MIPLALAILAAASVIGFFCATIFFALRDFSVRKLEEIAQKGRGTPRVAHLIEHDHRYARAAALLMVLSAIAVSIAAAAAFTPWRFTADNPSTPTLLWPELIGSAAVAALLILVLFILVPISLARHAGEKILHAWLPALTLLRPLAAPLIVFEPIDLAVKRLAGEGQTTELDETEDELLSAVTEGERAGRLGPSQRDMIEAVVTLSELTAEEIMTPRTDVEGFELTDNLEFIKQFIAAAGHSRIPIYEGDLDHIVGMLYAKDLIPFAGQTSDGFALRPILREVLFVPESKPVNELLIELQARKVHLAIVLDEYGGTAGLVTFEDILEEIVGEIQDEYEPEHEREPEITVDTESRAATAETRAYLDDVNDLIEPLGVQLTESDDYDTLNGYILAKLGRIPVADEEFQDDGCIFRILEAEPTRVLRVRIELADPAEDNIAPTPAEQPTADNAPAPTDEPTADHNTDDQRTDDEQSTTPAGSQRHDVA